MPGASNRPIAVVTGGAQGIGRAIATRLLADGYGVALLDTRKDLLDAAASELTSALESSEQDGAVLGLECNVCDAAQVRESIDAVVEHFGQLNVAVNNVARATLYADVHLVEEADWDLTIEATLKSVWLSMKYEIPHLLAVTDGHCSIVNISSVAGLVGTADNVAQYVAAKHGVVGLTKAAALQYATRGLRVNAVCPGTIMTPALQTRLARSPDGSDHDFLRTRHPMERIGEPSEIASAVSWLASPAASFVTGVALPVDGGWTAR